MPRPRFCRNIAEEPRFQRYKPAGIPARDLPVVTLTLDEFEAIRLADYKQMYQEEAAHHMNISRQTFGRILESAHHKIASALLDGACLNIEGGSVTVRGLRLFGCRACQWTWEVPYGTGRPEACPKCGQTVIRRIHEKENKVED